MIVYGHSELIARWAGNRLGIADWGPCATIGIMRRGELVAAAVFHQYRHPNIEISFVTTDRRWGTPEAVRAIIRYPFIQLGCKRLTSTTEAGNQRAIAFLCRMGFRLEGTHPDALPSGTALSFGLLRKDAEKWIAEDAKCSEDVLPASTVS